MRQGRKEQRERDWLDRILDELQARKEQGESLNRPGFSGGLFT